MERLPKKKDLMAAILSILQDHDGVLATSDINSLVANQLGIPDELLEIEDANCTGTEYSYRMRWARTELKQRGLIRNVKRGEWCLVDDNSNTSNK